MRTFYSPRRVKANCIIVYWDRERGTGQIDNDISAVTKETASVKADAMKVTVIPFSKFFIFSPFFPKFF